MEYRYVLGTGLPNGKHTADLSFPKDDLSNASEFRVYKPQLRVN